MTHSFGFPYVVAEGLNGIMHGDQDDELGDPEDSDQGYRNRNRDHYHHSLFVHGDDPRVITETKRAYLFGVSAGQFWCPKSLCRRTNLPLTEWIVWREFLREYI